MCTCNDLFHRFGMLFSLKEVVARFSPTGSDNLHVMKTSNFILHHFQSLTGFVFVINTKADVPGMVSLASNEALASIVCVFSR